MQNRYGTNLFFAAAFSSPFEEMESRSLSSSTVAKQVGGFNQQSINIISQTYTLAGCPTIIEGFDGTQNRQSFCS